VTLAAGSKLGPYEILAPLGAGGMGEVYRARDTRLGREVAIKVLPERLTSAEARQRFEREARTISALSHPHICALYDVGNQDGVEYLVMEYLEGQTLSDRLSRGPLPLEQTLRYGIQIADALDRAHRQGIVHRDLKPGNVMLTNSGVKLLDFGLAKVMASERPLDAAGRGQTAASHQPTAGSNLTAFPTMDTPLTETGTILGTFHYMAPEQLEGREADARTDIFALGAVLYEMATGRKAFEGASQASLIGAILRDQPKPVSAAAPLAPASLDRVVGTCLAKDPEDRWQSARDVKTELAWIAEGRSSETSANARPNRSRIRERIAWISAAAAVVAALLLIAIPYSRPSPTAMPQRFSVLAPEGASFAMQEAPKVSPDGRTILYTRTYQSGTDLMLVEKFH
jgi:serine/threonine protein kinase